MPDSYQDKLTRVRKPRVHITYKVWDGGAEVERELPFVVGVLGDFSGQPTEPLKPLAERKFIQIDRDNFDDVMKRMTPGLNLRVQNTLQDDGSEMAVALKFQSMADFDPAKVAEQVPALRKLLETREKLKDLLTKTDRSPEIESFLERILQNPDDIEKLKKELDALTGGSEAVEPAAE